MLAPLQQLRMCTPTVEPGHLDEAAQSVHFCWCAPATMFRAAGRVVLPVAVRAKQTETQRTSLLLSRVAGGRKTKPWGAAKSDDFALLAVL